MSRGRDATARGAVSRLGVRTSRLSDATKGVLLVATGVVVLSPDSLLIRLMTVDEGTLLLLRGAFSFVGYVVLQQLLAGGVVRRDTWRLTRPELAVGFLLGITNVFFVTSILRANAALALVIIASAPAFTAVLSRLFTREVVAARTWIASWVVLAGVAAIFATEPRGGELIGALAALGTSVILAVTLVVRRSQPVRMLPALTLGALITAVVGAPFLNLGSIDGSDIAISVALGFIVLPISLELIWRGPRYISAPEVSLILLLEAILGPALIWLALGDPPTIQAVLAGVLILGTLATHAVLAQRALSSASS
jgi:drug/metabolite transporter (DMT)-like permease